MKSESYLSNEKIPITDEALQTWAKKINCEMNDLIDAIFKVGASVKSVTAYLEMNRKIKDD